MFLIVEPFGPGPATSVVPVVVVVPFAPNVSSSTPLGATVATITVTLSNGHPFTGILTFGPPYFDDGGIYAISGSSSPFSLIVNPSGPGVGSGGGSVENVTVVATQ